MQAEDSLRMLVPARFDFLAISSNLLRAAAARNKFRNPNKLYHTPICDKDLYHANLTASTNVRS
jgi:hypothetical protein